MEVAHASGGLVFDSADSFEGAKKTKYTLKKKKRNADGLDV